MKIYLAARYSRRDELRQYKTLLEAEGIEVTSRWLNEKEPLDSQMGQHTDEFYVETATIDIEDVEKADLVLFFAEDPLVGWVRGGRHVEFGYALGIGKSIAVVGPKENVFHYLPQFSKFNICHFESVTTFIESYKKHAQKKLTGV
jgi:nucleoside 2-deoxyribosyltransferase